MDDVAHSGWYRRAPHRRRQQAAHQQTAGHVQQGHAGPLAGFAGAALFAWLWSKVGHRINLGLFFQTTAIFLFSLWGFKFVEQQFFPVSDRNEVVVDLWLPEGSTYQATEAEVQRFERRLNGDPRIKQYTSYVGRGIPHFFFASMGEQRHSNYGAVVITARNNAERDALFHEVWQWLQSDFPNVKGHVSRFENGPPTGYPVRDFR